MFLVDLFSTTEEQSALFLIHFLGGCVEYYLEFYSVISVAHVENQV